MNELLYVKPFGLLYLSNLYLQLPLPYLAKNILKPHGAVLAESFEPARAGGHSIILLAFCP